MTPLRKILLVQLRHLGDVLLTTPAIRATRRTFKDARIDFLTTAPGRQVLDGNPQLDSLLIDPSLLELFRARYDAVVDMNSVPRSALRVAATRAPLRIGVRGRGPRNLAYNRLVPRETAAVYMPLQKLEIVRELGVQVDPDDLSLEIAIGDEHRRWARNVLASLPQPIVAVSPVAKHEHKQWGAARWGLVAEALSAAGASIVVTSGPGEQEQAAIAARSMTREPLWQYGDTTVRHLAALYAECALWVGNDGGPKHIAVAAGTPTVTVIRKSMAGVWNDLRAGSQQVAVSSDTTLQDTTPDQVITAALAALERSRRTSS